ncbi:unnamed protein product, partial [Adineta ricciae]
DIYGSQTQIEVKDIFEQCNDQNKCTLVLGSPGIGHSTFCRYAAHQWATGILWPEYELVVLVSLRRLTTRYYPPLPCGSNYSLIDVIKREYFADSPLSENDQRLQKEQLDNIHTLWLLAGYDEIVLDVPA